ncbi:hypothetical protein ZHAS_00021627 [Anopheles sinensis]|uniref:Uncharacterized protein n=1 Tax=Anopheles sinensis TaxID=74873 RepID=A0A084WSU3_ANOSI|nr:hypothetical protein ZHAS_00021627 [Anopheles sinensis]
MDFRRADDRGQGSCKRRLCNVYELWRQSERGQFNEQVLSLLSPQVSKGDRRQTRSTRPITSMRRTLRPMSGQSVHRV